MLKKGAVKVLKVARKGIVKSSQLTGKAIATKAAISVIYQSLTQRGEINLFTVIGDSFFVPYVGGMVGNCFTLNFSLVNREFEAKTIFSSNLETKDYVAAITRVLISGTLGKYFTLNGINNTTAEIGGNILIHTNINALSNGVGKTIEQ